MIRHFWLSSSFFLFLWNKDVYGNFFIPKMFKGLQKLCCRKPQLYVTEKVLRFAQRHLESSRGTSCSCALQGSIALDRSKPCSPALSQKSLSPVVSQNVVRSSLSKQYPGYKPNTPTQNFNQSVKPSTPKLPQPPRSKPNTPNMPQYLKSGLSPSFSTSDLKGYSTPKASKFPKLNSVHSSPDLSSTVISSQTDRLSNNGSPSNDVELKGRLSRNVSHESLSSLSGSVKDIPQHSHSTRENGRSLSSYSGSVHDDRSKFKLKNKCGK